MGSQPNLAALRCECGKLFRVWVLPIRCSCGRTIKTVVENLLERTCRHRSSEQFELSCRCGSVNRCNLLAKYCGHRDVTGEFVNLIDGARAGEMITSDNFQNCRNCDRKDAAI